MSIPEPILLLGAERVARSEADLLPKLKSLLAELTQNKNGRASCQKKPFLEIKENGCWEWLRCKGYSGYGQFEYQNKRLRAHRFFYERFKGKIYFELVIDHLCQNKKCCNPNHLESVTQWENDHRSRVKNKRIHHNTKKTHCKRGHEFKPENIYPRNNGRHRECRKCLAIRNQKTQIYRGAEC